MTNDSRRLQAFSQNPSYRNNTYHEEGLSIAAELAPIEDNEDDRNGENSKRSIFAIAEANPDNFSSMVRSSAFQKFLIVLGILILCIVGVVIVFRFVFGGRNSDNNGVPTMTPITPSPAVITTTSPTPSPSYFPIVGCISDTATLELVIQRKIEYAELCPGGFVLEPTTAGATGIDFGETNLHLGCASVDLQCTVDMREYKFTNYFGNSDLRFENIFFATTSTKSNLFDNTIFLMYGRDM